MLYKDKKRRLGDRYDGFKLRKVDTLFQLIPVIMRTRTDSLVYFEDEIDITEVEQFIRKQRRAGVENLSMLQLFMSAIVRVFSLRPRLNRFVAGKKIYARNTLRISLTVKHSLTFQEQLMASIQHLLVYIKLIINSVMQLCEDPVIHAL